MFLLICRCILLRHLPLARSTSGAVAARSRPSVPRRPCDSGGLRFRGRASRVKIEWANRVKIEWANFNLEACLVEKIHASLCIYQTRQDQARNKEREVNREKRNESGRESSIHCTERRMIGESKRTEGVQKKAQGGWVNPKCVVAGCKYDCGDAAEGTRSRDRAFCRSSCCERGC